MKIKHNDILISPENPFENCKLGRKKYAEILTKIIETYADGFVLAINNEWGTGKTTFVKMWQQQLINNKYRTLYFNAWENDFDSNPIVPILSELKTLIKGKDDAAFKSLLKKGAVITKKVLPALLKAVADKYLDSETVTEVIKHSAEVATDLLSDEINEYANKKKGLKEFREELSKYIKAEENDKPIVFIIDELDRCRPDYAVAVLEQIKHFFSVPGIVFVLSIDKEQLGHAVRGIYGCEQLNADEYLRRFIDLEYTIPAPSSKSICDYFYNYFDFQSFFLNSERLKIKEFQNDGKNFLEFATIIFEKDKLTIRQQEKLFGHTRLVLLQFHKNQYALPGLLIYLIYLRAFDFEFYNNMKNRLVNVQDLINVVEDKFKKYITEDNSNLFIYLEVLLILLYFNYHKELHRNQKLIDKNINTNQDVFLLKSSNNENEILRILKVLTWGNLESTSLSFLFDRIELLENLSA